ncbi:MAG: hypothetical protein ABMB14_08965 [Myxococcota bacterium]
MSVTTLLALVQYAHAFAPVADPGTYAGGKPVGVEPQRIQWQSPEVQGLFLQSPGWQKFVRTDGSDWRVRIDESTGTPWMLWGKGIPMPVSSADALTRTLSGLLSRHRGLLGFADGELSLVSANYSPTYDTWYVTYDTLRDGLPTYRGGISAQIKHGNLLMLTVHTAPNAPVVGSYALSADAAISRSIADGPAPLAAHTDPEATRILLEVKDRAGLRLVRTWMVKTRTQDPVGIWVTFVDAETGELLNVHNEVAFIDGTVTADHHERTVDGSPLVNSPVVDATVDGDADSDITGQDGTFSVVASVDYVTDFAGEYARVFNDAGAEGLLTDDDPDLEWTVADATQAEIDSYVFVHQVRDWGLSVEPNITSVAGQGGRLGITVNINQACNAYYDGSLNFFEAGQNCSNTGQIADVVYHEWGHGFHAFSVETGTVDGSVGEAAGDTVAMFNTGDHLIAPFFIQGGGAIRDVEPDHAYPEDIIGEVHEDGLIYGGAMWDLRNLLIDELGEQQGIDVAEAIFVGALKAGPTIPETYYASLVADDDDGDLSNGTPHQCTLIDAFTPHGIEEMFRGATYQVVYDPLVRTAEDVETPIDLDVIALVPECVPFAPVSGGLHWRSDGGAWQNEPVTITGEHVAGAIPALPLGTFVEYYIEGDSNDGRRWKAPFSGEFAPYSFFVGDVIEIVCEDFEASDGGYLHELVSGDPDNGADDWQWGTPFGSGGDPSAAFSGDNAWGNDLGGGNFNGQYQTLKFNRLWSPLYDTQWYTDVFLSYRRWLNVEDGFYDQAVITANGNAVWLNHDSGTQAVGNEQHQDRQWVSHAVDLENFADQTQVELGWELHSDGGLEFGGWTIDDVCLYAPLTADNRLAIVDFVVTDQGGPIGLAWTNPIHEPVSDVKVIRRTDRYPAGVTDGEEVADIPAPVPGEQVQAVHGNADGSAGYYAVYAFDGTDWLSWTIEGWNAGYAAPNEGGTGTTTGGTTDGTGTPTDGPTDEVPAADPKDEEAGGCNCDGSGGAGAASWLAVGALLLLRRRAR